MSTQSVPEPEPSSQTSRSRPGLTTSKSASGARSGASKVFDQIIFRRNLSTVSLPIPEHHQVDRSHPIPDTKINDHKRNASSAEQARAEHRTAAKEKAKQYREKKKIRAAAEKARNQHMGGAAWGFDPHAGISPDVTHNMVEECHFFRCGMDNSQSKAAGGPDDLGKSAVLCRENQSQKGTVQRNLE